MPIFPKNSMVRITQRYRDMLTGELDKVDKPEYYQEFLDSSSFIFLGPVHLREDAGIFVSYSGKVFWPFLIEHFELIHEEEM